LRPVKRYSPADPDSLVETPVSIAKTSFGVLAAIRKQRRGFPSKYSVRLVSKALSV